METKKKRIAIWMHSGIGGGNFSQGQPAIGKIVEELTKNYEVVVYSQLSPNEGFATNFTIYSASRSVKFMWLRWLYLFLPFFYNHIKNPHQLFYAFWGYPAGLIAVGLSKLLRKPSVVHLQGGDTVSLPEFRYGAFYGSLSKKLSVWTYTHTSLLIALTQFQKAQLNLYGIKRRVEIIPYGPDLRMFKFKKSKFQSESCQFIHIGNHNPLKDQITLLKTFSILLERLGNCNLKLIGHDALNGNLKKYSIHLGIDRFVTFIEPVPYHEIPNHLYEADVLLHTSLYEGQATVISEAAASGVLLAGTRVGLLSDLGDNYGLVVNVGDADALAEKIINTLHSQETALTFTNRSRKWAEEHDHEWTIATIKNHIQNLMS